LPEKLFIHSLEQRHADNIKYHLFHNPRHWASGLSGIILGGQDGLVNVLGVILGIPAATSAPRIVIVARLEGEKVFDQIKDEQIISMSGEGLKHR
jgi:hypothetical protein